MVPALKERGQEQDVAEAVPVAGKAAAGPAQDPRDSACARSAESGCLIRQACPALNRPVPRAAHE